MYSVNVIPVICAINGDIFIQLAVSVQISKSVPQIGQYIEHSKRAKGHALASLYFL